MMVDVIQTSFPPLKKVIQFVCGNGLICETVKEARQIAFDGPRRLKVSTIHLSFKTSGKSYFKRPICIVRRTMWYSIPGAVLCQNAGLRVCG